MRSKLHIPPDRPGGEDPFNVEKLRINPAKFSTPHVPAKIRKRRSQRRFTKFPGIWEEVLAKAKAPGATYAVAIVLLHEAWKLMSLGYKPTVKLTDVMLNGKVGARGKRMALRNLSRLGLASVEQPPNRNPIVTVRFFD